MFDAGDHVKVRVNGGFKMFFFKKGHEFYLTIKEMKLDNFPIS